MAETSAQRGLTVDQFNSNKSTTTAPNGFAGSTQEYLSEQEQAAMLINKVLTELKGACPGWRSSIATKEDYDSMRQQWLIGFLENGITSDFQINEGMAKARKYNKPFLPSVGQFIEWCNQATGVNYPPMEAVFAELQEWLKVNRKDWHNASPLLQHIIRRNLDLYNYKQVFKDYDRVKLFEIAYKAALFQFECGIEMEAYPHPKTLIENKPYTAPVTPAVIEKTQDVRAALLAMLDDKPEDKQLTQDEVNDLQRLEKIRNET